MAAPPPLLLSLLLLSSSSISYCSDEGTTTNSPATKDVIIQYWNLKFPNKPLPSFFLSKLSAPSPLQLMATATIHGSRAIGGASTSKLYGNPATANYESEAYREPVTAKYEAYRKPVTANYDSKALGDDSEENTRPVTANYDSGFDKHATASYSSDAYRKPVTVNYNSDSDAGKKPITAKEDSNSNAYKKPVTANYDSGSNKHATASYSSDAHRKPVTVNYDYDSDASKKPVMANDDSNSNAYKKPVTANYDSGSDKHATANYSSDAYRKPVTVKYNSDSDASKKPVKENDSSNSNAYKKPVTANYDSDGIHATTNYGSRERGIHAPMNYGARGNHATANYDFDAYMKPVTTSYDSDSKAQGNHATASYGAHANHATANYNAPKDHPIKRPCCSSTSTTDSDLLNPKANRYHATTKNGASNSNNIRMVTGNGATGKVEKSSSNFNVFFRESNLTRGTIMPMCNIKATMPQMSFLPRSIATMLPFSSPHEVKKHFQIPQNSRMSEAIDDTISNCNSDPGEGETKACLTSAEDLIDFVRLKLGPAAMLRNTESAGGSEGAIMVGEVKSVKGDKLTELVACHQAVFPYMVYLCHSVPKVKMYEADILDAETKEKINHGIAICHFDTSNWSEGHTAFIELGFKPGEIEACHWMFEGEMAAFAE